MEREGAGETSEAPVITRRRLLRGALNIGLSLAAQQAAGAETLSQQGTGAPQTPTKPVETKAAPAPMMLPPLRLRAEARVHLNQVGYLPDEPKRAVVSAMTAIPGDSFCLLDDDVTPQIRFQGKLLAYRSDAGMKYGHYPYHFWADFDAFQRPGRYRLRLSDGTLSAPFSIRKDLYKRLVPLVTTYFDLQRCGEQRSSLRKVCHPDDGIIVGGPRSGQAIDASGGWHDAGDYLKFVETTSYVTALLLFTHEHYGKRFPGHGAQSDLPLLLDYAKVGLDWLLKMHPSANEFYYQVGDESDHNTWRLPEKDSLLENIAWKPRQVLFGVGANLAGRTAAAFAMASRLYKGTDAEFANRCRGAAETVYRLGVSHPQIVTSKPADFYPETTWTDDMEWAAVELFKATGVRTYLDQALAYSRQAGTAGEPTSVYNTHALAHYALHPHAPAVDRERLLGYLRTDAELTQQRAQNPYGLGTPYVWGTTEVAAGAAITGLLYAALSGETEHVETARRQRDFILGCNPFGISFLVGAGSQYPLFPHHQISSLLNTELTGALVGGPANFETFKKQNIFLDTAMDGVENPGPVLPDDLEDEIGVYHDAVQDYVTNEPANDYTVKLLLLLAFYLV